MRVQSLKRRFISLGINHSYRFTQAHEVHQKRGVARDVVHMSAVRLTPRSLVPRCRPLFNPTGLLLSVGGLLLTAGCLLPRCSSFSRLRLSGGRDLSPAAGHRRYIPASTLPNRGCGTGGIHTLPPFAHAPPCAGPSPRTHLGGKGRRR